MNPQDEKTMKMYKRALNAMGLAAENKKVAKRYLDTEQPEDTLLLDEVEYQDFSTLSDEAQERCYDYAEHLSDQNLKEDLARYIRFCAAIGGSTARYTLFDYHINEKILKRAKEYLTLEHYIAIEAEELFHSSQRHTYEDVERLWKVCGQNPQVLRKVMELCYCENNRAKSFLAGIYLHYAKPSPSEKKEMDETSEIVNFLEDTLISIAPRIYAGDEQGLTDRESDMLKEFLRNSAPDADFPKELQEFFHKHGCEFEEAYTIAKAGFLAMEHSDRFQLLVRFAIFVDPSALNVCSRICREEQLENYTGLVEKWVEPSTYASWCFSYKMAEPLQRMAATNEDIIRELAESWVDKWLNDFIPEGYEKPYQFLMKQVKKGNPSLHQALEDSYNEKLRAKEAASVPKPTPKAPTHEEIRDKVIKGLTSIAYRGEEQAAVDYLLGIGELSKLDPYLDQWREENSCAVDPTADYSCYDKLMPMRDGKDVPFFRRAMVFEAMTYRWDYFLYYQVYDASQGAISDPDSGEEYEMIGEEVDRKQLLAMLDVFAQENLTVMDQLEILEAFGESFYYDDKQAMDKLFNACADTLAREKTEWAAEIADKAKIGSVPARLMCIRVLNIHWTQNKELLLSCVGDNSPQVRELITEICISHKEWESDIVTLLGSKKVREREMAIQVLKKWGVASHYQVQLKKALQAEKNSKLKSQLTALLGVNPNNP